MKITKWYDVWLVLGMWGMADFLIRFAWNGIEILMYGNAVTQGGSIVLNAIVWYLAARFTACIMRPEHDEAEGDRR